MAEEEITFVGPTAASAKLDKLLARPGMVERVAEIREQMATVDRAYAQSLVAIRKAADLTQVELATQMGVAQSEISRIEKRHDMLLSTLTSYLSATGEHPRLLVTVHVNDVELYLTPFARALSAPPPPRPGVRARAPPLRRFRPDQPDRRCRHGIAGPDGDQAEWPGQPWQYTDQWLRHRRLDRLSVVVPGPAAAQRLRQQQGQCAEYRGAGPVLRLGHQFQQ